MKITLVSLCFLLVTGAAFGQAAASGVSSEPVVYDFHSHAGHASQQSMAQEQNLFASSPSVQAHGVRPLWEVAKPSYAMPLGDAARLLRKEHAMAKKADIIWNN